MQLINVDHKKRQSGQKCHLGPVSHSRIKKMVPSSQPAQPVPLLPSDCPYLLRISNMSRRPNLNFRNLSTAASYRKGRNRSLDSNFPLTPHISGLIVESRIRHLPDTIEVQEMARNLSCLLYTSPSPRDQRGSRMPSTA